MGQNPRMQIVMQKRALEHSYGTREDRVIKESCCER